MKKFMKISLITAGIMLSVGITTLVVCAIIGGSSLVQYVSNLNIPASVSNYEHFSYDFENDYPIYTGDHINQEAAPANDIHNLNINIGGGNIVVSESSDSRYIQLSAECHNRFQYYAKDGTFYVQGFDDVSKKPYNHTDNTIYLKIPAGMKFDNVNLELGAGTSDFAFLNAASFSVEAGAGTVNLNSLNVDKINASVGAGSIEFDNSTINDATFEIGLGSLFYNGTIKGNLNAECGMGSIELEMNDSEKAHNYTIDGSMGTISVDNKTFEGFEYDKTIDNNASSNYNLSCAMGSITVSFKEVREQ